MAELHKRGLFVVKVVVWVVKWWFVGVLCAFSVLLVCVGLYLLVLGYISVLDFISV